METVLPVRRRSYGSIRSPNVKRDSQSVVIIKGWLFKLEGGAIKQWKRRWCVLSDFCLFFYKSPDEDKVFSSVLLPSCKVNPCSSEDRISKKFAFKVEHQNMKTYFFSAEDKENMTRWMNAMSLASIMQNAERSNKVESDIRSTSYEEEDSGFASYRSRRYHDHDPNSTFDSNHYPDGMKQRSHSCSDRVNEVYLNSDDKYPTFPANSQQYYYNSPSKQTVPRRQPLYANAPPKPRRLTQSEPFVIAPTDQYSDALTYANHRQIPYQYQDVPEVHNYSGYPHLTYSDAVIELGPVPYVDYPQETSFQETIPYSNSYPSQANPADLQEMVQGYDRPPRPHSADFLERETECFSQGTKDHKAQPRRPKSSLEYCDKYWEAEEPNGQYDYHKGTNNLPEDLYINQNNHLHRELQQQQPYVDQLQNLNYGMDQPYFDPLTQSHNYSQKNKYPVREQSYPPLSYEPQSMQPIKKKRAHEESMRRLMEWKQRMLQSPLSRRTAQYSSSSSDAGSPRRLPGQQPPNYHTQVMRDLAAHEARLRQKTQHPHSDIRSNQQSSATYLNDQYYQAEMEANTLRNQPSNVHQQSYSVPGSVANKDVSLNNIAYPSEKVGQPACHTDNQQNVLYCVDSENNELLIYGDNYVADVPDINEDAYYSQKKCGNGGNVVSSAKVISNKPVSSKKVTPNNAESRNTLTKGSKSHLPSKETSAKGPPASQHCITSYSSDDEDNEEKKFLTASGSLKKIETATVVEIHEPRSDSKASPDYVNISIMNKKCLNISPHSNDERSHFDKKLGKMEYPPPMYFSDEQESRRSSFSENSHKHVSKQSSKHKMKGMLDMNREDYHRACQMFFSSLSKNNSLSPPSCKSPDSSPSYSSSSSMQKYMEKKYKQPPEVLDLDKDVGLPLPPAISSKNQTVLPEGSDTHMPISKTSKQTVDVCSNHDECPQQPKFLELDVDITKRRIESPTENTLSSKSHFIDSLVTRSFDNLGLQTSKKHVSFEELRLQLQRQREAPPPNIVQERIKRFECAESKGTNSQETISQNAETDTCKLEALEATKNHKVEKISKRKFKHKNPQQCKVNPKRTMHSDTEAVVAIDSVDSCSDDDMTMKSAPILLSPLSSVLADLRKTADHGKEEKGEGNEHSYSLEKTGICGDDLSVVNSDSKLFGPEKKLKYEPEEEAYLPMDGLKNLKESDYVAMDDNPSKPAASKSTKVPVTEEPVYNEPLSPPQSFLHDVYGKQKGRCVQFEPDSSSSDESSSEHIYEKPRYAITTSEPSLYKGANHRTIRSAELKAPPLNPSNLLNRNTNRNFQSNSRSAEQIGSNVYPPCEYKTFRQSSEMLCTGNKHMTKAHINQSVPDLLQLQDIKDSEASDADDEASRDFDTSVSLQLPSYQSVTFTQSENAKEIVLPTRYDGHSSFDSEIMSLSGNQDSLSRTNAPTYSLVSTHNYSQTTPYVSPYSSTEVGDKNMNYCPNDQPNETYSANAKVPGYTDDGKKVHLRKLRIYTKGKKPESSKLASMPYDIESSDTTLKAKSEKESVSEFPSIIPNECQSPLKIDCDTTTTFIPQHLSFVPDVIPAECIDEKLSSDKDSLLNRSPNSAPYYYSDLLPEGHICNVADFIKRNESTDIAKCITTKPAQVVLNNVSGKSPTYISKGDIGRKVNKISNKTIPTDFEKVTVNNNEKSFVKNEAPLITVADLKRSLNSFYTSESKYLDAERNKYEAGHTLEKTRRINSTLTYLKQRSSTPDLKGSQGQVEPVYENLTLRKTILHKRLSCSLEAISKPPEHPIGNPESDIYATVEDFRPESPVYENLTFFQHPSESKSFDKAPLPSPSPQLPMPQDLCFEPNILSTQVQQENWGKRQVEKEISSIQNQASLYTHPQDYKDNFDLDNNYLNQNELRRVSQQYFLGHLKERTTQKLRSQSNLLNMQQQLQLKVNQSVNSVNEDYKCCVKNDIVVEGKNTTLNDQDLHSKSENIFLPDKAPYLCDTDENSSSSSSSSSDEASVDTEYAYRQKSSRSKISLNQTKNVSDSEIQVREPCHLKKLVQLSEGVMNKGKRLSVSAGDLLGKTHEELVLLLIQLRRNQARIIRAKEKCLQQLENVQQFSTMNECMKQMYTKNFSELMQQVTLLEKQFETTRPLINLVDNMVKLGSLYGSNDKRSSSFPHLDTSCDFSSQKRVYVNMPLDLRTWSSTEETELQDHLNEMCHVDKGLSRETHSFSSLQQDKEMLEYTLHGMRSKILDHQDKPIELQKLRKQQRLIEKELTRVKRLLSHSAKKIEDATTKNDQLEQQILLLKQKLQQVLKTGSNELKSSQARADLEAELSRVQNVLKELANHRQEISNTVETLKSDSQSRVALCSSSKVRASPTGVAGSAPLPLRKKQQSTYLETDLDTMQTYDLSTIGRDIDDIPVYANADELNSSSREPTANTETGKVASSGSSDKENISQCSIQDINEADDKMKRFYGILPREKPCEIKTVRIVKRQSERRNKERDKKRVTYGDQSSIWMIEEPDFSSDDHIETDEEVYKKTDPVLNCSRPTTIPLPPTNVQKQSGSPSAHERLFGGLGIVKADDELTTHKKVNNVKSVKRSKRRHYTVSGCQYLSDPQFSEISREKPRSRDDVDMERCLRTANTPDIVRSTIKKKEAYDENIIERELGLPQKIKIPERYIEDEPERLSASEKLRRSRKAENIRKMLSETTATYENVAETTRGPPEKLHEKCTEQKRKRAHLLALNHALAQEVMQRSKAVAVLATFEHLMKEDKPSPVEDLSPMVELPITQQRYNMLC